MDACHVTLFHQVFEFVAFGGGEHIHVPLFQLHKKTVSNPDLYISSTSG